MPKDRNAFQLGLMVIVVLTLFVVAILFIGSRSFEPREPIVVRVAHDQKMPRIKAGAPIICGPQQVGRVTSVAIVEAPLHTDPDIKDYLYFEIRGEVNTSLGLRADCRINVEGPLLGENGQLTIEHRGTDSIRISPDTPIFARAAGFENDLAMITGEFDERNPRSLLARIKSQLDPMLPQSIVAKLHNSLDDVNNVTTNLKHSFDPTRANALISKVDSVLNNVDAVTEAINAEFESGNDGAFLAKLHRGLDVLDRALVEMAETIRENRDGIRSTVARIEHVATELDEGIVPAIAAELDRANTESLIAQVRRAFEEVTTSLADVGVVTTKARQVATLSEDRVLVLIENMSEASAHLKALAKDLRRSPWRLIHKPQERESRQAYVLDAVREFADAAAHLDDSVSQVRALLETGRDAVSAQDPALVAVREKLMETLERFNAAEEALWSQLDVP